jgi:UDP-GlcNAc:undecaprenyl-phosphate GlcNAc-1-phosphate transferase
VVSDPFEVLLPWLPAMFVPWLLAVGITPLVIRFAHATGILDRPRGRKQHPEPVPLLGGVALALAMVIGLAVVAPLSEPIHGGLWGFGSLSALALCGVAMVTLGTWDDLCDLTATRKALFQIAIAAVTWSVGFRCGPVEFPFGWALMDSAPTSFLVTVLWIMIVSNAFNLIDGIDGLTAGTGIVAALVVFFLASKHGASVPVVASLALVGALAGFLRFNLPPARIFLGDGGALGVGYLTAVLAMASSQKSPTAVVLIVPMLALGLPLLDTFTAIFRRTIAFVGARRSAALLHPVELGRAVMSGDRGHVHFLFLRAGWSVRSTLFVLYALSAGFGVLALWIRESSAAVRWTTWGLLLGVGLIALRRMEARVRRLESDSDASSGTPGAPRGPLVTAGEAEAPPRVAS